MKLFFYPMEAHDAIRNCFRNVYTLLFGRSCTQLLQHFGRCLKHGGISIHNSRCCHRDDLWLWLFFFHATSITQGVL